MNLREATQRETDPDDVSLERPEPEGRVERRWRQRQRGRRRKRGQRGH